MSKVKKTRQEEAKELQDLSRAFHSAGIPKKYHDKEVLLSNYGKAGSMASKWARNAMGEDLLRGVCPIISGKATPESVAASVDITNLIARALVIRKFSFRLLSMEYMVRMCKLGKSISVMGSLLGGKGQPAPSCVVITGFSCPSEGVGTLEECRWLSWAIARHVQEGKPLILQCDKSPFAKDTWCSDLLLSLLNRNKLEFNV